MSDETRPRSRGRSRGVTGGGAYFSTVKEVDTECQSSKMKISPLFMSFIKLGFVDPV